MRITIDFEMLNKKSKIENNKLHKRLRLKNSQERK